MRAHEFIFEQSITDQDAQAFLLNLLASSYSLKLPSLDMSSILKSMLDQGYLRDARWVLNTIKQMPDDDNLIVNKDETDHTQVVFQTDVTDDEELRDDDAAADTDAAASSAEQTVDNMAQSALNRRI
jgi:hypothetical protein